MTKIDIFSGFLGAGKTTLIKKTDRQRPIKGEKLVLIENEFGEIGIDGGFLQDAGIKITEMNSGCICCSLVGDFGKALKKVTGRVPSRPHPHRAVRRGQAVRRHRAPCSALTTDEVTLGSFVTVADATKVQDVYEELRRVLQQPDRDTPPPSSSPVPIPSPRASWTRPLPCCGSIIPIATIVTTPWGELTGRAADRGAWKARRPSRRSWRRWRWSALPKRTRRTTITAAITITTMMTRMSTSTIIMTMTTSMIITAATITMMTTMMRMNTTIITITTMTRMSMTITAATIITTTMRTSMSITIIMPPRRRGVHLLGRGDRQEVRPSRAIEAALHELDTGEVWHHPAARRVSCHAVDGTWIHFRLCSRANATSVPAALILPAGSASSAPSWTKRA